MKLWKYTFILLLIILGLLIIAIFQVPDGNLHIIVCDVGQGDAILAVYKNTQILTDGGPDSKVVDCLGRYLPFWDKQIELVISTHPDADHLTGLTEVVKNYKVEKLLINSVDPGTQVYKALEKVVKNSDITTIEPVGGMKLKVGLIYLDILHPSEDLKSQISNIKAGETNLFSIVYVLTYGQFKAFMPGDIPPQVSEALALNPSVGRVNYIKIPHHGSINGLTQNLLEKTRPSVAVISVGAKNIWGFPRPEILNMLNGLGAKILRTDESGDIEFITDGNKYWVGN